jgi:hypothetical protein
MATDNISANYQQLVSSYQAIDTFRTQLLARLPLATGSGIFLLYATKDTLDDINPAFLLAIGLFGIVVTLSLFVYEIYGIKKCSALITTGKEMEVNLGIKGQFLSRPNSFFNEPFAAGLIYPAVLASWTLVTVANIKTDSRLVWFAPLVFGIFSTGMMLYNLKLLRGGNQKGPAKQIQKNLSNEQSGDRATITQHTHSDFTMIRLNGEQQDREQFLNSIPAEYKPEYLAAQSNVHLVGQCAIYTSIVATSHNPDGTPGNDCFWITRLFVKEKGQWVCQSWHVMNIQ